MKKCIFVVYHVAGLWLQRIVKFQTRGRTPA